jgi:AraC family transcriptional regulator
LSNTSHIASSIVSSPDRPACRSRDETLVRLLTAATATFDSDRDQAKACVQQAAELLRVSLERDGYPRNESSSRGGLAPWQAKRVVAYIESNINLSFRVADLAGIVQLSVSHFSRAFRESFGQPPLAYVKVRRVRRAQVIMQNTREPLSQVALDCGMCDQAHFTRVFRKIVGISPNLWRRQFQFEPNDVLPQATHEVSESEIAGQLVRDDAAGTSSPVMGESQCDMGAGPAMGSGACGEA